MTRDEIESLANVLAERGRIGAGLPRRLYATEPHNIPMRPTAACGCFTDQAGCWHGCKCTCHARGE